MLRAADTNIAHQWILTLAMKEQRGRTSGLGKRLFADINLDFKLSFPRHWLEDIVVIEG